MSGAAEAPLRCVDVTYAYPGASAPVFSGLNLDVHAGCTLAVIGRSGSGKTTLLNLLGLLDRPASGQVRVAGADLGGASDSARALARSRELGFIFQRFHLREDLTAAANVRLGHWYSGTRRSDEEVPATAALAAVGLGAKGDQLASTLSGGEQQRVAIARALVREPSVLLCDEPTGNLDDVAAQGVLELLWEQAAQGVAVVIVTHDLRIAERVDRVFDLSEQQAAA